MGLNDSAGGDLRNSFSDVSSLFLQGDKLSKVKKRFERLKNGKGKKMTKAEEKEKYLLSQFTAKDLPNHRFYHPNIEAPFSELDYSSDYLDEYHGGQLQGDDVSLDFDEEYIEANREYGDKTSMQKTYDQTQNQIITDPNIFNRPFDEELKQQTPMLTKGSRFENAL